jgi:hypothetical protein
MGVSFSWVKNNNSSRFDVLRQGSERAVRFEWNTNTHQYVSKLYLMAHSRSGNSEQVGTISASRSRHLHEIHAQGHYFQNIPCILIGLPNYTFLKCQWQMKPCDGLNQYVSDHWLCSYGKWRFRNISFVTGIEILSFFVALYEWKTAHWNSFGLLRAEAIGTNWIVADRLNVSRQGSTESHHHICYGGRVRILLTSPLRCHETLVNSTMFGIMASTQASQIATWLWFMAWILVLL